MPALPHLLALALGSAPAAESEWLMPSFETSAPPPSLDGRFRFEVRGGLWLAQQASRLRTTQPGLGVGASLRPLERVRIDGGYRFSLVSMGSSELNVLNTFHALAIRGHYAHPIGSTWLTLGGGPLGYLTTSSQAPGALSAGGEIVAGAETEVSERLVRFEAGVATRGRRWDLQAAMVLGF